MDKAKIKTIRDLVAASAEEYGEKVFVKEKAGNEISEKTFSQFCEDVRKTVSYVNSKKTSGNAVHAAVIGPSSYAWLVSWFGTVCGGNVSVPLDAQLPCPELCELLNRSDSEIFFYDSRYEKMIPIVKENCPNVKEYVSFGEGIPAILDKYAPAELTAVSPDALAAISYTSGTTGKSKGVMLLNSNYIDNAMCQDGEGTTEDVLMSVLPIHHIYCFTCDILLSLRYGMELCFNDSMLHITQNLQVFRPTAILIVPMIAETVYNKIKAAAASSGAPIAAVAQNVFGGRLKTIFSGGAYLRPELQKAYIEMGFNMAQGYGMTECAPRISTARIDDKSCDGDVGIIVNGAQVKTVDDEIWVKSPSVMAGYYKDPEETAKTLTPDGWLMTGDLGYVDENNRIFITGRKKNLIILSNGENVSPEELENKFAGIDYIAEVLVSGEEGVITAEIFPNPEFIKANPDADIEKMFRDTVNEINKNVTSSKTIRRLRIRDTEFDKTTSKKIIRKQSVKGREIT